MTLEEIRARNRAIWFDHKNGKTMTELARAYGITKQRIHGIVRLQHPPVSPVQWFDCPLLIQEMHQPVDFATKRAAKDRHRVSKRGYANARDLRMMEMYRAGLTLQQIGERYHITRERVRQILRAHGVSPQDGGASKRGLHRRVKQAAEIEARCIRRWGCGRAEYLAVRKAGGVRAFRYQARSAGYRGIEWGLTLKQWWDLWQESGHWHERGCHAHEFCMSRVNDAGGYVFGNVYITTARENIQEFRARAGNKRNATPGVYHMYPGYKRGFVARYGDTNIGFFETHEAASIARDTYVRALKRGKAA